MSFKTFSKYLIFIPILSLALIEILSFIFPQIYWLPKLGIGLWIINFLLILFFAVQSILFLAKKVKNKKCLISVLLLIINIAIIFGNTWNYKNVSGETTQEISCMLNHLENSPDWGFNSTCLFGYPARQYLIPTLPSVILGRNVFALNFGGCIYLILGLIILSRGLIKYFGEKCGSIAAGIFLTSIWHIPYFMHFTFRYEQSIFPISLGMITIGILLSYFKKQTNFLLAILTFCLFMLIQAYTPTLAFFFLSIGVLIYYLLFQKEINITHKALIFILIATCLFSFYHSLSFRTDIKIFDSNRGIATIKNGLAKGFRHLIFLTKSPNFVSPLFHFCLLFTVLSGTFGLLEPIDILFGFWIIAVLVLSIVSKGYTYYGIAFRLHRAMIVFPIIWLLVGKIIKKFNLSKNKKSFYLIIVLLAITGFYNLNKSFKITRIGKENNHFAIWIHYLNKANNIENMMISQQVKDLYPSHQGALKYFLPKLQSSVINLNTIEIQEKYRQGNTLLILKNNEVKNFFQEKKYYKNIGNFDKVTAFFRGKNNHPLTE